MKKFRDMTDSEKLEIISAALNMEPLEVSGDAKSWAKEYMKIICFEWYYRIPNRPMSIDWSVLKDEYICAARDHHGFARAFQHNPANPTYYAGSGLIIDHLKSYDPGTVEWDDSLIWRPGHEPK